jgi:phosphoglycolate phosphatase
MALLLWDIDYTLIEVSEFRDRAYTKVFQSLTGQPFHGLAMVPGCTSLEKIQRTLTWHSIESSQDFVRTFADQLARIYHSIADFPAESRMLPGALATLRQLSHWGSLTQTVVTGSMYSVARAKIDAFGLLRYLDMRIGGYGNDGTARELLIPAALSRYAKLTGAPAFDHEVVVVGDTVQDVAVARRSGVHVIGVASGLFTTRELSAAGADAVVSDLNNPQDIINIVYELTGVRPLRSR